MARIRIPGKLPYLQFLPFYNGAPQRRIFFPDWYIKLVKPYEEMPANYVRFHVPPDMTKYDVKEYLHKLYNISVANVRLAPVGRSRFRDESRKWHFTEPYKIAHVRLGDGQTFQFPNLVAKKKGDEDLNPVDKEEKRLEYMKEKDSKTMNSDSSAVRAKLNAQSSWFQR